MSNFVRTWLKNRKLIGFLCLNCKVTIRLMASDAADSLKEKNAPISGSDRPINHVEVEFGQSIARVGYVDYGSRNGSIILALHGGPGSVKDFAELFSPLEKAGFRFVVPEFPGYGNTTISNTEAFDESTEARAQLINAFIKKLSFTHITAVIGHSMGVATAFHLAANSDMYGSVVDLSGIGVNPHRTLRPYWMTLLFSRLLANGWTGPLVSGIIPYAYSSRGYTANSDVVGLKLGIISASRIDFEQVRANVGKVREKKLPILFAFTQNDKLIEESIQAEMAETCGIPQEEWSRFDASEVLLSGLAIDEPFYNSRCLIFERGGHFVHRSHQSIIADSIISLVHQLEKTRSKIPTA